MITSQQFDDFRRLLQEKSAIVLEAGKEYLVETRLAPLIKNEGLSSLSELFANIRRNADLLTKVVDAMTTNETLFFRDMHPFIALKEFVLPNVIKSCENKKQINIWSAACSSGQEACSIAITLLDNFPQLADWKINILCTDISNAMLERVKNGLFSQLEINRGMPANCLIKHFTKQGLDWKVNDNIKKMLDVKYLNLAGVWPAIPFMDIVFLRNVLIYFESAMKQEIINKISRTMSPDGYFFMGSTENMLSLNTPFKEVHHGKTTLYSKSVK